MWWILEFLHLKFWRVKIQYTLFFYKNQYMSAETPDTRMFLILIHILSNSHRTPTPNTCLECFSWPKLSFGKIQTKFEPRCSYKIVLIKRKECISSYLECAKRACVVTKTVFTKSFLKWTLENSNPEVHDHFRLCQIVKKMNDFSIQFLENAHSRGKYLIGQNFGKILSADIFLSWNSKHVKFILNSQHFSKIGNSALTIWSLKEMKKEMK